MKTKLYLLTMMTLFAAGSVCAQLKLPRESQRQMVAQTVGDATVSVVYFRPNVKGRKIWDGLEKYGKVWRTGANEATIFEVSSDVKINGQPLAAGKYSLHTIPNKDEWTVIFNRASEQWGSFQYDPKQDALRVSVKPTETDFQETMSLGFENVKANTADVVIVWEKIKVPFTVDVGDVVGRVLPEIRKQMTGLKADDARTPIQAANYILNNKYAANYQEAVGWLDAALKNNETYGLLFTKAKLQSEMNKKADAIATAERAMTVNKAAAKPADTTDLEKLVAEWKNSK